MSGGDTSAEPLPQTGSWLSALSSWWSGTSREWRSESQFRLLSARSKQEAEIKLVGRPGCRLCTIDFQGPAGSEHLSPVVLIHGFGMGSGLWARQFDQISKHRRVIAIDLPGMGCSECPRFEGSTPKDAEDYFISAITEWQKSMGIPHMVLVGHAFGAYLAAVYTLRRPKHVTQLLLSSPAGIEKYSKYKDYADTHMLLSLLWRMHVTPQSIVRAVGLWLGARIVRAICAARFMGEDLSAIAQVSEYVYHLWVLSSDAERAYRALIMVGGFGRAPLCDRLHRLRSPATFIFGEHDWKSHTPADNILPRLPVPAKVVLIANAGHHVYLDNSEHFNALVCRTLNHAQEGRAASTHPPTVYCPTPIRDSGDNSPVAGGMRERRARNFAPLLSTEGHDEVSNQEYDLVVL